MTYLEMTKEQQKHCDELALWIISGKLSQIIHNLDDEYSQRLFSGDELDEYDESIYRALDFFMELNEHNPMKIGWYLKDLYESTML